MHSVTDRQTDDRMMPIADHTVLQYDRLKGTRHTRHEMRSQRATVSEVSEIRLRSHSNVHGKRI